MGQPSATPVNGPSLGWLLALGIGAPAAEAIVLQVLGFVSALPLAPQLSAPAPFGGFGLVAGWEAREMLTLVRLESPALKFHADIPFLRSMVKRAPQLRDQTLCPIPGEKTFMFIPLQAAMMAERGPLSRIRWDALPGWHATLLKRAAHPARPP